MTEEKIAIEAIEEFKAKIAPLQLPVFIHIGLPKTGNSLIVSCGMEHLGNRRAVIDAAAEMVVSKGGLS